MSEVASFGVSEDEGVEDAAIAPSEDSILDDLTAEMKAETESDLKWYPVPKRPNIELRFSTNIDFDLLKAWFKSATKRAKGGKREFDPLTLGYIAISNQTRGIRFRGRELTLEGEPLTLLSDTLQSKFGGHNTRSTIKAVIVSEGHIISIGQQIIDDAGYGEIDVEAEEENPLQEG